MKAIGDTLPRRFKAKASGSITAGKPLIVEADGDVTEVAGSTFTEAIGSAVIYESGIINFNAITFDSNAGKTVVAWGINTNVGYAEVGTVTSGNGISFGSSTQFDTGVTEITATFDSNSNKVVLAYTDANNSSYGTAIVGTVSGTSISFGSTAVFESATTYDQQATFDSTNNKVVIVYRDGGNNNYGTAVVGTVSGTSISFGTPVVFESNYTINVNCSFDSSNGKVFVAFSRNPDSNSGQSVIGTVSGTSISFGSIVEYTGNEVFGNKNIYDSKNGKVVIIYKDQGTSNYMRAIVGTISGTSVTYGSPVTVVSTTLASDPYDYGVAYDSNTGKIVVAYADTGNSDYGTYVVGSVSGTTTSWGSAVVFDSNGSEDVQAGFDGSENKVVIIWRGSGSDGTARVLQTAGSSTNLTSENFIGIAEYAASDTETATVLIKGGVSTTQSSLTAGQTYFVQGDGTLGLTADDPSVTAGTAVTSTKLIVKG
tara:strand:- start:14 stop:1462 length:1449 start_codon:yes stop_codon:yes gene_type:complete